MTLLRVESLTKRFRGLTALDNVDFEVRRGEVVGLIGPNGAGKSTCFNVVTGFLEPSAGKVTFDGESIAGLAPHRVAALGLVRTFQHSTVFADLSVVDNVRTGAHLHARAPMLAALFRSRSYRREEGELLGRVHAIAGRVGLSEELDSRAGDLSYGHLRKLGIAIALATQPKCVMLDEPAAGLNGSETRDLLRLIRELRGEGISVVIVEHDMKLIMEVCDRIVVLSHGRRIAQGTPEQVRRDPEVIRNYLGTRRAKRATAPVEVKC